MQYHLCVLLLLVLGGHEISSGKLPSSFTVCKRNDPDLNECLRAAAQKGIGLMKDAQQPDVGQGLPSGCRHRTELTGDSTTLIPTTDNPGFLDQLMDRCHTLTKASRPLDAYSCDKQRRDVNTVDFDKAKMEMRADIPYVKIEGDYTMNGKFLVLPMKGEGKCNMSMSSNTNKVMNENWKELYQELRPTLRETLGAVFLKVANGIFLNVPEKDLLPES
ncbi:hypothetical protein C0J52_10169 [Blattella germanica]|nr:hypothetical protein C0J52_10169 [Blattella germanica]